MMYCGIMELSIKGLTSQVHVGCASVPIVLSSLIPFQLSPLPKPQQPSSLISS